jgi:hypothetical protein
MKGWGRLLNRQKRKAMNKEKVTSVKRVGLKKGRLCFVLLSTFVLRVCLSLLCNHKESN